MSDYHRSLAQCVLPVGVHVSEDLHRNMSEHIALLGTCFAIRQDGYFATANHVVMSEGQLAILLPQITHIDEYQDQSERKSRYTLAKVVAQDPIRDIAILHADVNYNSLACPTLDSLDSMSVGDPIAAIGYPHATDARRVLTLQKTSLGAKIMLDYHGIKTKNCVINVQTRPGQSGSPVLSLKTPGASVRPSVVAMLLGAYMPANIPTARISGVYIHELNQTTHCVAAQYINEMMA